MAVARSPACPPNRSAQTVGIIFLVSALLASCGSDSETPADDAPSADPDGDDRPGLVIEGLNGTPSDQLTSPWLANMSFFRRGELTPGSGDAYVELLQYSDDFQVSSHIDFYTPELDTCEIRDLIDDGNDGEGENRPDYVSGGQSMTLNTSTGTWFDFGVMEDSPGIYQTNNGLPGPFPADLTLSIPGDIFPSIAEYPLVEPVAPIRILPTSDVLTMDDLTVAFTWIPGETVPGGYVELAGIAYDANDEFLGFPIVCSVVDDGSFIMPQNVIDAFAAMPAGVSVQARFERAISRVDFIDGVVFYQKSAVSE